MTVLTVAPAAPRNLRRVIGDQFLSSLSLSSFIVSS
jgi:hypothetical protein